MSQRTRELKMERWKGCLKKRRYRSEDDAAQAAQALKDDTGHDINHYRCLFAPPDDPHWHVGHVSRRYSECETSSSSSS